MVVGVPVMVGVEEEDTKGWSVVALNFGVTPCSSSTSSGVGDDWSQTGGYLLLIGPVPVVVVVVVVACCCESRAVDRKSPSQLLLLLATMLGTDGGGGGVVVVVNERTSDIGETRSG